MVQNLKAYFTLYAITIKGIMCVQEKIEFFDMFQRPWSSFKDISGDLALTRKVKQQQTIAKKFLVVPKS